MRRRGPGPTVHRGPAPGPGPGPRRGSSRSGSGHGQEAELTGLESHFVRTTSALVCVIDRDCRMVLVNPALQRFTGRCADDLLGQDFCDVFVAAEHVELARDAVARAIATGVAHPHEGDWLAAGGVRRRIAMQNDVLVDDHGRPWAVACMGLDVTERRGREEKLHRRAHTDLLTGLGNRSALFEALSRHLDPASGGGCGVLFCDLDDFKVVNDRYGHAVGDQVLVEVAARLQELVAPGDLVARFGGDEFVFLCPAGDQVRLRSLAQQVVQRIGEPVPGPAGDLVVGVSVGMATAGPGEAADVLIARADDAMYGAKSHHRRRYPRSGGPAAS